jgi:hypothetical protein
MPKSLPDGFFTEVDGVPTLRHDVWFNFQVGRIVCQVNSVEMYINGVIAHYYGNIDQHEHQNLKDDIIQPMTLDAKIRLVKKIALSLGVDFSRQHKSDLYKWKETRNFVAHGVPLHTGGKDDMEDEIVLVYEGNFYDIDILSEDFFVRQARLTKYIESIQKELLTHKR